MKKILFILITALGIGFIGCRNQDLCNVDHSYTRKIIVEFHWDPSEISDKPGPYSMRGNFFAPTPEQSVIWDFPSSDRDTIQLALEREFSVVAYDYNTERQIYFRKENSLNDIEALCAPAPTRPSFTRDNPQFVGQTYNQPPYPFYVGTQNEDPDNYPLGSFILPKELQDDEYVLHFYPRNVAKMYTYRIMGSPERDGMIGGLNYAEEQRGAISGMSASYYLGTGLLGTNPVVIYFNAERDLENGWIVGKFATFGPLSSNEFMVDVKHSTNHYESMNWDVSDQVADALCLNDMENPDIIIEWDLNIIPVEPGNNGGIDVDIIDWGDEVVVPLAPRFVSTHSMVICPNCGVEYLREIHIPVDSNRGQNINRVHNHNHN